MPPHTEAMVLDRSSPAGRRTTEPRETCILINPRSFRVRDRKRLDQICAVADNSDAAVHIVQEPTEIAGALASNPAPEMKRLIIIGGDGTVQAAISALLDGQTASLPQVLALGGGRTNFTARDLGTHNKPVTRLAAALRTPEQLVTEQRAVLKLEQASTGRKIYGLFVAGAVVDHVIRDCHRYRARHRGWLRTGRPSSLWRVLQLAATGRLSRDAYPAPTMRIHADGLGQLEQPIRLLVLSTLHHQRGLINPYAEQGVGNVRVTAISNNAQGFWTSLPNLLVGRPRGRHKAVNGYLSGRCGSLTIRGLRSVCVDGQECQFCPSEDVIISADDRIDFLAQ